MRQRNVMVIALSMSAMVTGEASAQGSTQQTVERAENHFAGGTRSVAANYVRAVRVGNLLFVSGTTSRDLQPFGKVGRELTVDTGYQAARHAGLLFLANVRAELGTLDRVRSASSKSSGW